MSAKGNLALLLQLVSFCCELALLKLNLLEYTKYQYQLQENHKKYLGQAFCTVWLATYILITIVDNTSRFRVTMMVAFFCGLFFPLLRRFEVKFWGCVLLYESVLLAKGLILKCVKWKKIQLSLKGKSSETKGNMRSLGERSMDAEKKEGGTLPCPPTNSSCNQVEQLAVEESEEKESAIHKPLEAMKLTEKAENSSPAKGGSSSWLADAFKIRDSLNVNSDVTVERASGSILRPATFILPSCNNNRLFLRKSSCEKDTVHSTKEISQRSEMILKPSIAHTLDSGASKSCSFVTKLVTALLIVSLSFNMYFLLRLLKHK